MVTVGMLGGGGCTFLMTLCRDRWQNVMSYGVGWLWEGSSKSENHGGVVGD